MLSKAENKNSLLHKAADRIHEYRFGLSVKEQGTVISVGDGVAWINGLPSAEMDEVLDFSDGSKGLVFYLGRDIIGAILLRQSDKLSAGTIVHRSAGRVKVPVGDSLLGRVVDPLGHPLDGEPIAHTLTQRQLDIMSPPIVQRTFVEKPLYTGIKIIDTMIPIGKGQRQLIIGDNGLGKSSLCLDAVINQRGKNVRCVYVLIGQKRNTVTSIIDKLKQHGALSYTTVVVAEATALPGLQYLAPFAGCSIAEEWMWRGMDTLVIYDDLSTHARVYRELSLLLRRPPGREAYPGDIFYLHSRLLERSTALSTACGEGTMTALPIVETDQGEIATYIPTNLISITDGQLYLDRKLCVAGFLPAIDITRSVSRIGGKAQHKRVREEVGRMKLDYLQYLELEVFTRFNAKLDTQAQAIISRGRLLKELLKQERFVPASIEEQLAWLIAYNDRLLDNVQSDKVNETWQLLVATVKKHNLTLDTERQVWLTALSQAFQDKSI